MAEPKKYQFATAIGDLTDEYQKILPVIKSKSHKYGALEITREMIGAMVDNWKNKVMGEREPYLDIDHFGGEAAGWFPDIEARDDGLYVKIEWTELGREKVEKRLYRYFSAEFGEYMGLEDGEIRFPVLYGAALTNRPLMSNLPAAHLSENTPAHSDGENDTEGDPDMGTLKDVLDALFALSDDERGKATDEDRGKAAKALDIEVGTDTEAVKLSDQIVTLKTQLSTIQSERDELKAKLDEKEKAELAARKANVIELAVKAGKILPKNREKWEKLFDADPEGTADLLAVKGSEVDLTEHGTPGSGAEAKLSDAELEVMHKMGLTDEDIKNHGGNL